VSSFINPGGTEVIASGGTAIGTAINGGLLEVASGGSGGDVKFDTLGGTLQLDASQTFSGTIAGFASPPGVTEQIDLADLSFGKNTNVKFKEAKDGTSGTLTIKTGKNEVDLTLLGQYTAADFNVASDGAGGTVVTDPGPVASATNAIAAVHGSGMT
jgi:autotransporter passenger strand-loop-strand repeat protein